MRFEEILIEVLNEGTEHRTFHAPSGSEVKVSYAKNPQFRQFLNLFRDDPGGAGFVDEGGNLHVWSPSDRILHKDAKQDLEVKSKGKGSYFRVQMKTLKYFNVTPSQESSIGKIVKLTKLRTMFNKGKRPFIVTDGWSPDQVVVDGKKVDPSAYQEEIGVDL